MDKLKIKVVKKDEVRQRRKPGKKAVTPRAAAREMVSTVSDWVIDLKERKSEETRAALDLLFGGKQQPNQS
jgi:hypothetical protein